MLTLRFRLVDIINMWRKDSLSLEPIRAMMGAGLADYLQLPFTYCWSPSLVRTPADWPSNIGKKFSTIWGLKSIHAS